MIRYFLLLALLPLQTAFAQPRPAHNLRFDSLATRWDEAMPLGNGEIGALVWNNGGKLRLSVDRVDLWDDRPMPGLDRLTFSWVVEQVRKRQYDTVQRAGDAPYDRNAFPTKIPGAALEFNIAPLGRVTASELNIATGMHEVRFADGAVFSTYVHAGAPYGVFTWENAAGSITPELITPVYAGAAGHESVNSLEGGSVRRLGYARGNVTAAGHSIRYRQPTHDGRYYEVLVEWKQLSPRKMAGVWTITNNAVAQVPAVGKRSLKTGWKKHAAWWKDYWARSAVQLPEAALEKQYYLDMYKFGSVARAHTPPISLQAVWTADNGKLPPWKGDFHHDLNTELSYWPGYTANHLDLTAGFTNWLWRTKEENKRWTKQYFGVDGLNVPGVNTVSGKPMGGWIQYSMSPTTAAWLAQHFYWQWKFSNDARFLQEQCKPWFDEVMRYLTGIRVRDNATGLYRLPLSSSPEHNDNSISAWYTGYSNYDLALIRFFFEKHAEVTAAAAGSPFSRPQELDKYPLFDVDSTGLTIAPGHPLKGSHRHHSHLIGIYPLKVIRYPADKEVIDRSLAHLHQNGTRAWVGYSFPWAASLYAQTGNGDSAVSLLRKFASNFVLPNSFHVNGDQRGGQYSGFTYRPFTLEGNFAFAQGVHELLLQSGNGVVEVFPALPAGWKNVSFRQLRAEGGWLVSAAMENGRVTKVVIRAGRGGEVRMRLPFSNVRFAGKKRPYSANDGVISFAMRDGEEVTLVQQ